MWQVSWTGNPTCSPAWHGLWQALKLAVEPLDMRRIRPRETALSGILDQHGIL